jgi:hypothetical protein
MATQGRGVSRDVVLRLVAVALASRLLVLGVAALAEATGAPSVAEARAPTGTQARLTDTPLLASLTTWDGFYYLDIAQHGYSSTAVNGPYPNTVFFPLYPAVVRVVHDVTGIDWLLGAVLLSNAAFVAAMVLFGWLSRDYAGGRSMTAVVLLSLAPGGTAFSMAYADSLFLLLTIASFVVAERGRSRSTAVVYVLVTLCRPVGLFLGPALALLLWRRGGWRSVAWLVAGPVALLGFAGWQGLTLGDSLAFVHGQQAWAQHGAPATAVPDRAAPEAINGLARFASAIGLGVLGVGVGYIVAALLHGIRRRDAYAVYSFATIGTAAVLGRLASLDRYFAPMLPVYWLIARASPPVRFGWAAVSAVVLAALSYLNFQLWLPP